MRIPRLRPWPRTGFRVEDGGRGNSGRATVELYMRHDEFWPMMEWAALHVARRISRGLRAGEPPDQAGRRFGLLDKTFQDGDLLEDARSEPSAIAPAIIRDLTGLSVTRRTLEAYRARWARDVDGHRRPPRTLLPGENLRSMSRTEQYRFLEQKAVEFLRAKPPRPSSRGPRRNVPAYPWLY